MASHPMPDLIVVIPGILGSVLHQHGKEVWGLSAAAGMHALATRGGSVRDLTLVGDSSDPAPLGDGVTAIRLLRDLHVFPYLWKIDGYSKLIDMLTTTFAIEPGENFFEFPYDWRRDNRAAGARLAEDCHRWLRGWRERSGNAAARLILVAHSMGGLVARHYLEVLEGWRDTKALITFGTPYRGSVNALRTLVEGVRKGPFGIFDITSLARSFTSLYQLLPTYPCLGLNGGDPVHLSAGSELPGVCPVRLQDAIEFHSRIRDAVADHLKDEAYLRHRYRIIPVVGTHQKTLQSAQRVGESVVDFFCHQASRDLKGDGTVPRISATPVELSNKGFETYVADCHASMQNADGILFHIGEAMANLDLDLDTPSYRGNGWSVPIKVSLEVEEAFWDNEPVIIKVQTEPTPSPALWAVVTEALSGVEVARINFPAGSEGWATAELPALYPGVFRCKVEGHEGVNPVVDVFSVFDHLQR